MPVPKQPGAQDNAEEIDDGFLDAGSDEEVLGGQTDDEGLEGETGGEDLEGEGSQRPAQEPVKPRQPQPDPELEILRRENELLRRQQAQPAVQPGPREETEQEFEQRVAPLELMEQMSARLQRAERRSNAQLAYLQASTADQLDRANYNARAASDQRYARYADEVERRHQAYLSGSPGVSPQLVPRETILRIIIGEKVLGPQTRQQNRQQARQQSKQQQRSDRQRPAPPNNRSDAVGQPAGSRPRETDQEARKRRLENVEI
jgi:hypothetical protein